MNIIFGLFTVILFVDCILLIAFVLVQLPKKEAGAGMAFGGAATDALFGAGSGSAVTIITKYLAGIFFGLSLLMAIMTSNHGQDAGSGLINALGKTTAPASHAITELPVSKSPTTSGGSNAAAPGTAPNSGITPGFMSQPPP